MLLRARNDEEIYGGVYATMSRQSFRNVIVGDYDDYGDCGDEASKDKVILFCVDAGCLFNSPKFLLA